jgi:hypothetical protein
LAFLAEGKTLDFGRLRDLTKGFWGKQVSINRQRSLGRPFSQKSGFCVVVRMKRNFSLLPFSRQLQLGLEHSRSRTGDCARRPRLPVTGPPSLPGQPARSALFSAPLAGPSGLSYHLGRSAIPGLPKQPTFWLVRGNISGGANPTAS